MSFEETPYEQMEIAELDIEELESRLEMASLSGGSDVTVEVGVKWTF